MPAADAFGVELWVTSSCCVCVFVSQTLSARLATVVQQWKPALLRGSQSSLAVSTPSMSWDDVIGLTHVKESLMEVVVLPATHPQARPCCVL